MVSGEAGGSTAGEGGSEEVGGDSVAGEGVLLLSGGEEGSSWQLEPVKSSTH